MQGREARWIVAALGLVGVCAATAVRAQECGRIWHEVRPAPTSALLHAVTWGNGMFVAVGEGGSVITSPDGSTWTARTSGTTSTFLGIGWGPPGFVAVGENGTAATSVDGVSWLVTSVGESAWLTSITWTGSTFIVVGPSYAVFASPDGAHWTAHPLDFGFQTFSPNDVAASPDRLVAVGSSGDGMASMASTDGISWTLSGGGASDWFSSVTWTGNTFVAVGGFNYFYTGSFAVTSNDGVSWNWDGRAWLYDLSLERVATGGGLLVAVGSGGAILTSPDANAWTRQSSGTDERLTGITFGDSRFVVVGEQGEMLVSSCVPPTPRRRLQRASR